MPSKPEDEFSSLPREADAAGAAGQAAPGEFTQMFGRLRGSEPSPEAPATKPPAAQPSPGEFTQIFTPLAKPTTTPEALRPAPVTPSVESNAGEFTQFFSALSARSEGVAPPRPAPPPPRPAPPEPVAPPAVQAEEPGTFTQLLQQIQGQSAAPVAGPGERVDSSEAVAPSRGSLQSSPAAESSSKPLFGGSPQRADSAEIFRRPQPARDLSASDAQVFAAPRQPLASPPAAAAAESFTDIFARVTEPPRAPSAPVIPSAPPVPSPFAAAGLPERNAPLAGPGEFTQLMQNLAQPAAAAPVRQEPVMPVADAFFAEPAPSRGGSEFTRVMRGDALRGEGRPVPRSNQVASGSPMAPGLAIAPTPAAPGAANAPEKKPNRMVLLLIVINGVLLLALLMVAIIYFLHRH